MLVAASTNPSQAGAVNHSSIWSATCLGLPQNIGCSFTVPPGGAFGRSSQTVPSASSVNGQSLGVTVVCHATASFGSNNFGH